MNLNIVFLTALGLSAVCLTLAVVIAIVKAWNGRRVMSFLVKILTVLVILLVGEWTANWLIKFDGWGWILAIPISLITLAFAWELFKKPGPLSKQEDANYDAYLDWCRYHGRPPSFKEYATDAWKKDQQTPR
jgi:flagellar biosynthesis protein FliQ